MWAGAGKEGEEQAASWRHQGRRRPTGTRAEPLQPRRGKEKRQKHTRTLRERKDEPGADTSQRKQNGQQKLMTRCTSRTP